jgi:hypothetical protein
MILLEIYYATMPSVTLISNIMTAVREMQRNVFVNISFLQHRLFLKKYLTGTCNDAQ